MKLVTVEQSRSIDARSEDYALSSEILMEAAGALAAREIMQTFASELAKGLTSVVCGPGHNGGDGLVVARHLLSAGYKHLQVFVKEGGSHSDLFKKQLHRVQRQGLPVISLSWGDSAQEGLGKSTLVVDALFGIGSRGCQEEMGQWVNFINSLSVTVVSLDTPSGLDCDRGVVDGAAVKASMTLTFGHAKPGFFIASGPSHVGEWRVLPIGFPREVVQEEATTHSLFDESLAFCHLPQRSDQSHKANHGRLLVCAGREGYWGAGVLAALSAYRMGVGYVLWASATSPSRQIIEVPEVMTTTVEEALCRLSPNHAVAFGCGLGVNEETAAWIQQLKSRGHENVVLDADGLTTVVQFGLMPLCPSWVITPHSKELSRIIRRGAREIERDRIGAALAGAKKVGCHVLLKGFRSVFVCEDQVIIIGSGNSALATAGTGDVLTGMVGALLAQGLEPQGATCTAAYFHGRIADEWVASGRHEGTLTASDLKSSLPSVLMR